VQPLGAIPVAFLYNRRAARAVALASPPIGHACGRVTAPGDPRPRLGDGVGELGLATAWAATLQLLPDHGPIVPNDPGLHRGPFPGSNALGAPRRLAIVIVFIRPLGPLGTFGAFGTLGTCAPAVRTVAGVCGCECECECGRCGAGD
jgi:hypothetical protein